MFCCAEQTRVSWLHKLSDMHKNRHDTRNLNVFTGETCAQSHKRRHLGWLDEPKSNKKIKIVSGYFHSCHYEQEATVAIYDRGIS